MTPARLTIELVPRSCFFQNLRTRLTKRDWDALRSACYTRAGHRCEICGGAGPRHPVECHEIWEYDEVQQVQRLKGLVALCPSCHRVKHMALAREMGWHLQAEAHLRRVNGWSAETTRAHIAEAFALFEVRSQITWTQDLAWLEQYEASGGFSNQPSS